MKNSLKIMLALLFIVGLISCNKDDDNPKKPEIKKEVYNEYASKIKSDLKYFNDKVSSENLKVNQDEKLKKLSEDFYGKESVKHKAFLKTYEKAKNNSKTDNLTGVKKEHVEEIKNMVSKALNPNELVEKLDNKFESIFSDKKISDEDKHFLLAYSIAVKTAVQNIIDNKNIYENFLNLNSESGFKPQYGYSSQSGSGWWDSWGRTAAGMTSAIGTGALGGCEVGTAAGLGFGSIPGCGVGAIAGGVFGGLGYAADNF